MKALFLSILPLTGGVLMTARLRLKGRELLVGNTVLMHLVLATGIMLVLCVNFSVLIYELFLKKEGNLWIDFSVSLLLLMLSSFVCWALRLGTDRFFLRRSQRKGESAADLFCYFHPLRALGAIAFGTGLLALRLFYFLAAFIPFGAAFGLLVFLAQRGVSALVAACLSAGTALLFISGAVFYRGVSALLFLAKYHYICGDCISFRQIIAASCVEMKNRKRLLLRLRRSFYGWFILGLLLLPAGYVWSYYRQTMAVAANEFMDGTKNEAPYLQDR